LTDHPFRIGEFIWSAFPQSERPEQPGPGEHVAYTLAVSGVGGEFSAWMAYTTSRSWQGAVPQGVRVFDLLEAKSLGHRRAFVLDFRCVAYMPVTVKWFPQLDTPSRGILGRAPKALRHELQGLVTELFAQHSEIVERRGPIPRR